MNFQRVCKEDMRERQDYLVLSNRWEEGKPGVTLAIVDCANWSLASWDGSRLCVQDDSGHSNPPLDFEEFRAVFELPMTHTEFEGAEQ